MGLERRQPVSPPRKMNEFTDWQTRMRTAFFEAVSEDDMRQIVESLVAKAKAGDMAAIRMLLSYGIGSPTVKVQNAVIMNDPKPLAPLPIAPAKVLPGAAKLDVFAQRAANGQALFDPRDKTGDDA